MGNESHRLAQEQTEYQAGSLARVLSFHDRTLPRILQIQAALGNKVMINAADRQLTYADGPAVAARYAGKLAMAGVCPGDRVVTFMSSRIELLMLWFGVTWAGAILVPINTAFRGEQLRHAINTASPKLIFSDANLLDHLGGVADAVTQAKTVFTIDEGADIEIDAIGETPVGQFVADAEPVPPLDIGPAHPAAILYTSGTTGPSKGVICSHAQFYWWGVLTGEALGLSENDVLFSVLPFFHTNALNSLWQSLLFGATFSFALRFSAGRFWDEANRKGATITYLLGAMAHILLKQPVSERGNKNNIRAALCPATPIESVKAFQARFGTKLIEGYGSTETNLVFSNVTGGYAPGSMGRVVDGFEARIVDENDCDVEPGQPGELIVRHREPFSIASGYFGDPVATAKAWRNLWFHTGDRVVCKADGIHYFLDRIVDAIRRRGENISSWEVENALMSHDDIEAAAVVGVPSDLGSEEDVMAFVVTREGITVDPIDVIRFLETRLAYFAIPRYWEFVDQIPKTENDKVKKHILRAQGIGSTTWDREKAGIELSRG